MALMIRLGLASIATTLAEYAVYLLLVELARVHYVAAALFVGVFGVVMHWALNRAWVFRGARAGAPAAQLAWQLVVVVVGIVVGPALLFVLVDFTGLPYWLGWLLQNLAVFFGWTYPATRWLVFPAPAPVRQRAPRPLRRRLATQHRRQLAETRAFALAPRFAHVFERFRRPRRARGQNVDPSRSRPYAARGRSM